MFYHIPKCAGTYALVQQLKLLNFYKNNIEISKFPDRKENQILFTKDNHILLRALIIDKEKYLESKKNLLKLNPISFSTTIEDLYDISQNTDFFSTVLTSSGVIMEKEILKSLPAEVRRWSMMRNPFDWAKSMYYYTKSEQSSHEDYHDRFQSVNFEEFLKSKEIPSNAYVKFFLKKERSKTVINESLYQEAKANIEDIRIFDIKNCDKAIDEIFSECHGIKLKDLPEEIHRRFEKANTNVTKNLGKEKFEDMSYEAKAKFLEINKWDIKLYHEVIQNKK